MEEGFATPHSIAAQRLSQQWERGCCGASKLTDRCKQAPHKATDAAEGTVTPAQTVEVGIHSASPGHGGASAAASAGVGRIGEWLPWPFIP